MNGVSCCLLFCSTCTPGIWPWVFVREELWQQQEPLSGGEELHQLILQQQHRNSNIVIRARAAAHAFKSVVVVGVKSVFTSTSIAAEISPPIAFSRPIWSIERVMTSLKADHFIQLITDSFSHE